MLMVIELWMRFNILSAPISGKPYAIWNEYFEFYQDGKDIVGTFHLIRLEVLLHPVCWGIANSYNSNFCFCNEGFYCPYWMKHIKYTP